VFFPGLLTDPIFSSSFLSLKILIQSERFAEGLNVLTSVIDQAKNKAEVYLLRGKAFESLGEWIEALADYTSAVENGRSDVNKGSFDSLLFVLCF